MTTRVVMAVAAAAVFGLFFAPLSYAGTYWYDDSRAIDWRQTNQEWNISQGVYSG